MAGIFSHYYTVNQWKNAESISGEGSTQKNTQNIRAALPKIFEQFNVRRILDAPCGDYNWFQYVERDAGPEYIGGDIVAELVRQNQERFADEQTRFMQLDIVHDALPAADLWLCRDCLPHLAQELIVQAIRNFLASDIPYFLTSAHPECRENANILTGDFRLLNLELPPFVFPAPLLKIDDSSEGLARKDLVLWHSDTLREALQSNPLFVVP
jgi:hypothetical protein